MRSTMKTATHLLLVIALAGAAACGGATDDATGPAPGTQPPPLDITGTLNLASVDGNPLPAMLWEDHTAEDLVGRMFILGGSIVLRSDSTYTQTLRSRLVIDGVTDQTWNSLTEGTYSFAPADEGSGNDPAPEGVVTFRGEAGGQMTTDLTRYSLTQHAMVPGAAGQPDFPVTLVYVRE